MSSYLLLRNNNESGPYSMEEIRAMSLKAYDLIWIVGKSAAWRYPGEIAELKSFAPPVPEQDNDLFRKKPAAETPIPESFIEQRPTLNSQRSNNSRSVYVNLPSEKKQAAIASFGTFSDSSLVTSPPEEAEYDLSDIYLKQPSKTVRYSGKILWVSTILLLFGAGILTGFFISDRRKFFTSDENHPQNQPPEQQMLLVKQKNSSPLNESTIAENKIIETNLLPADSLNKLNPASKKTRSLTAKKNIKNSVTVKDTLSVQPPLISSLKVNDSLKQNAGSKTEALYQKIKAHPENYINLVTGRYSTGLFGGISSFPVTITNNSSLKMDLIVVSIEYVQNNDKVFKTENLSFNDLESGETVTMKAPKSSRGIKIITRIQVLNDHQPDSGATH
jgi:hypothetical protein